MAWKKLTEPQWQAVQKQLPVHEPNPRGGRPRADDRKCFEGILWILWTGAPWSELPERYGKSSTVHDRLCQWAKNGTLLNLWRAFLSQLDEQGMIRWNNCFVDGMFVPAKKGAKQSAKPSTAREQSSWYWPMARVLRSEFTWRRRPPVRSSCSNQRSSSSRKRDCKDIQNA